MHTSAEITEDGDILLILPITPSIAIKYKHDARDYLIPLCDKYSLILKEYEDETTIQFAVGVRFQGHRSETQFLESFEHNQEILNQFNAEQAENIGCWLAMNEL